MNSADALRARILDLVAAYPGVMNRVFWIGVFPGLDEQRLSYALDVFHQAVEESP
jgi:hypothetical protein